MKIYAVYDGDYEDRDIVAVFTDKALADRFCAKFADPDMTVFDTDNYNEAFIAKWHKQWRLGMYGVDDIHPTRYWGNIRGNAVREDIGCDEWRRASLVDVYNDPDLRAVCYCVADTLEEAINLAREAYKRQFEEVLDGKITE